MRNSQISSCTRKPPCSISSSGIIFSFLLSCRRRHPSGRLSCRRTAVKSRLKGRRGSRYLWVWLHIPPASETPPAARRTRISQTRLHHSVRDRKTCARPDPFRVCVEPLREHLHAVRRNGADTMARAIRWHIRDRAAWVYAGARTVPHEHASVCYASGFRLHHAVVAIHITAGSFRLPMPLSAFGLPPIEDDRLTFRSRSESPRPQTALDLLVYAVRRLL